MLLSQLISLFIPIFVFHRHEGILPMDIETYLSHTTLHGNNGNIGNIGNIDNIELSSQYFHNWTPPEKGDPRLTIKPKYRDLYAESNFETKIENMDKKELFAYLNTVPVYARTNIKSGYLYITYNLFFPYNGASNVMGFIPVGGHVADISHVTIKILLLDNNKYKYADMYFSAHTTTEGLWASDSTKKLDGHPLAYIAKGGHGMYNKRGYYFRYFGFGNDVTGDEYFWQPNPDKIIHLLTKDDPLYISNIHGFINFKGTYHNGQVRSLIQTIRWNNPDAETDKDFPLYNPYINVRLDIFIVSLVGLFTLYHILLNIKKLISNYIIEQRSKGE